MRSAHSWLTFFIGLILVALACRSSLAGQMVQSEAINVGGTIYAIPVDYIGQQMDVSKLHEIVTLHLRYPDLAPVGNTSGLCPHKIALSDAQCPYFSVFLEQSNKLPHDYDGAIRGKELPFRDEGDYRIFSGTIGEIFQWVESDGNHIATCSPVSQRQLNPDETTCRTWRRTDNGGSYELVYLYRWRFEVRRLDSEVSALVDSFRVATGIRSHL